MTFWMSSRVTLALLMLSAGCKQEAAPKPEDKKKDDSKVSTYPSTNPTSYQQPTTQETKSAQEDQGTGCTQSTCQDAGTLEVQVNGSTQTTLVVNAQTPSSTLSVRSNRFTDRNFKLRVTSDVADLQVTNNDAQSVTVAWTQSGSNVTQGQLRIKARDMVRCEKESSGSSCDDLNEVNSNDEDLTLPWSSNGTVGTNWGGTQGNQGGQGNSMVLSFGLQILSQILGLGGNQAFNGGNQAGIIGGGINNGWGNQAGGAYNNNGATNNWNNGGAFGNQGGFGNQGNGFGNQGNGFGNQGNGFGNQGNGFGNQGNGFGNQGNGFGNQGSGFGNNTGVNNGACSLTNCSSCSTSTTCRQASCTWSTAGICQTGAGVSGVGGACSYSNCVSCALQADCNRVQCTWDSSLQSCR